MWTADGMTDIMMEHKKRVGGTGVGMRGWTGVFKADQGEGDGKGACKARD